MNLDMVSTLNYCASLIKAGGGATAGIPSAVGNLVHLFFILIQVVGPILLVLWGAMDFVKGIVGQDEDKIKAGQKKFIQRVIAAVIMFLIVTIVQLVINVVGSVTKDSNVSSVWKCASDLINGKEK